MSAKCQYRQMGTRQHSVRDQVIVSIDILLNKGFRAENEVRLLGAEVGRNLECGNGWFECKDGCA